MCQVTNIQECAAPLLIQKKKKTDWGRGIEHYIGVGKGFRPCRVGIQFLTGVGRVSGAMEGGGYFIQVALWTLKRGGSGAGNQWTNGRGPKVSKSDMFVDALEADDRNSI